MPVSRAWAIGLANAMCAVSPAVMNAMILVFMALTAIYSNVSGAHRKLKMGPTCYREDGGPVVAAWKRGRCPPFIPFHTQNEVSHLTLNIDRTSWRFRGDNILMGYVLP